MFYKEEFSFELGTYASSQQISTHLRLEALAQFSRFRDACEAKGIEIQGLLNFKLQDLSYLWHTNLEVGVETLAIYVTNCEVPVIVIDVPTAWKDEPHHRHMAEFVHHHMEKSPANRRQQAAASVLGQLNRISIKFLEMEVVEIKGSNIDYHAKCALNSIDSYVGK